MSSRSIYFINLVAVCAILAASAYLQYYDGFIPCPLCILQRFCFAALGVLFVFAMFLYRVNIARLLIHLLMLVFSTCGILLAGRQVWLQHFGHGEDGECGVSLQYMLQVLPIHEVMAKVFAGSAECSKRGFDFLWLNMAEWALLLFILFFFVAGYLLFSKRR